MERGYFHLQPLFQKSVSETFSCPRWKDKDEADLVSGKYSHSVHREEVRFGDKQAFPPPYQGQVRQGTS